MTKPQVTIVVVPRERFSFAERSLENLYENTAFPFELVYVSAGAPERIRRYLEREAERKKFRLVRCDRYLSPNQARNLGLREVHTKYVVFLDNDTLVAPGWLDALVQCAEETGAWIVGPLYLYGEFDRAVIHMAGGKLQVEEQEGKRVLLDEQYLFDTQIDDAPRPLRRRSCDYVEFHCMLVRTEIFEQVGPLDEKLLSVQEERDCCLTALHAGGSVYVEPKAVVTFVPPPPCEWWDLPYLMLRWSEAWSVASVRHFNEKWSIAAVRHIRDKTGHNEGESIIGFGRSWRRRIAGLKIGASDVTDGPRLPLEEAELMIALFQSVDRDCFDLALTAKDGAVIESASSLLPHEMLEQLPGFMRKAEEGNLNLMVRPLDRGRQDDLVLIRVDDLSAEDVHNVRRYAFMTLQTRPNRYQCWLAVERRTAAILGSRTAPGVVQASLNDFVHLAGSQSVGHHFGDTDSRCPRVQFVEAVVGQLTTTRQLESPEILPFLLSGRIC